MRVIPLLFNVFFAAVLNVFSEDPAILAELVPLGGAPDVNETGAGYGLRSPCGVWHAVHG